MADIAILVAEEYERRVKNSRKTGDAEGDLLKLDLVSNAFALSQRLKVMVGQKKMELLNWVLEPKSQIGLAASNGFFSA